MVEICRSSRFTISFDESTPAQFVSNSVKCIKNFTKNNVNYLKVELYNIVDDYKYSISEFQSQAKNTNKIISSQLNGMGDVLVKEIFRQLQLVRKYSKFVYTDASENTTTFIYKYITSCTICPPPANKSIKLTSGMKPPEAPITEKPTWITSTSGIIAPIHNS